MTHFDGEIAGSPVWGLFEDEETQESVLVDLEAALTNPRPSATQQRGNYIIAFVIQDNLYIVKKGYTAELCSNGELWKPKATLEVVKFPENSVLELSDGVYVLKVVRESAGMSSGQFKPGEIDYSDYHVVSPFELKNTLIKYAQKNTEIPFLNAGRGNPNFVNTTAREAYAHLLTFSSKLAQSQYPKEKNTHIGFAPPQKGIGNVFNKFAKKLNTPGGIFLRKAVEYMYSTVYGESIAYDDLIHQLVIAALGSFYPDPPQVQPFVSKVMNKYMDFMLLGDETQHGFDVFMTEGATAGIMYTFKSLRINGLLNAGDTIAIITPIFTPYLELPELSKYDLKEIFICGDEKKGWTIPLEQLDKLKDPKIKALFLVNPTNPSAVSMTKEHVQRVGEIVQNDNPNLIVIADSVYAPFVDEYHSFMSVIPKNTIEMYSFSKYFGVTGWRMGMIVMHPDNVIDQKLLKALPAKVKKELNKRYSIVTETAQEELTFMQRLVLDSRDVAEAHTGGLATPQQTLMSLFAIFDMTHPEYKPNIRDILIERIKLLYKPLGIPAPLGPGQTDYYTIVDIKELSNKLYGPAFQKKLLKHDCLEFVFRLAMDYSTICLPIAGFHGPCWAIRVSLANLETLDYLQVGKNIVNVLRDMHAASQ